MKRSGIFLSLMVFILSSTVTWGQNLPNPMQVYRFFKESDMSRAGNIRWVEIWETYSGVDREWFMIEGVSTIEGLRLDLYHLVGFGQSDPIYQKNGVYIPADAGIWGELEQRQLFNSADAYIQGVTCETPEPTLINNVPSNYCVVANSTSEAQIWISQINQYLVRYHFNSQVNGKTTTHRYEAFQRPDVAILSPTNVPLNCFVTDLPTPPETIIFTSNAVQRTFLSSLPPTTLESFFEENLDAGWLFLDNLFEGGRSYQKQLNDATECTLYINYNDGPDNQIFASIDVHVTVEYEQISLPELPISVNQSAYSTGVPYSKGIYETLADILGSEYFNGWSRRDSLSVEATNSMFITMQKGDEERYIVLDARPPDSNNQPSTLVRLFERPPIHASLFSVDNR